MIRKYSALKCYVLKCLKSSMCLVINIKYFKFEMAHNCLVSGHLNLVLCYKQTKGKPR